MSRPAWLAIVAGVGLALGLNGGYLEGWCFGLALTCTIMAFLIDR